MNPRTTTTYLQVRKHDRYPYECAVVKATTKKPRVLQPGCVVIKLRLEIPEAAWAPFEPEAIVKVPVDLTMAEVIEVEAEDPNEDES